MTPATAPLAVSGFAFALALLLAPLARNAFLHLQLVDSPDGRRKLHSRAVPRVGGISIAFSYMGSFLAYYAFPDWRPAPAGGDSVILWIICAAALVFLTGLFDDIVGLRPWQKLAGIGVAAAIAFAGGVRIAPIGGELGGDWLALPLTMLWLAACANAFNLIDGLDGLATGLGLLATFAMFLAACVHGSEILALAALPLAGSLLGFLRYNFHPASVFLGDGGSLLIGFLLGCFGVIWSQQSATTFGRTAPLLALAAPLLDVGLTVGRRWLRGQPILRGDRSHIHHKLLERGLTHRGAVLILYATAGLGAVLSLAQGFAPAPLAGLVIVAFCAAAWAGIAYLGYPEFSGIRRAFKRGAFRHFVTAQITLHELERRLRSADSVEECWAAVQESSRQMGFSQIDASFHGRHFTDQGSRTRSAVGWRLGIPLGAAGRLNVSYEPGTPMQPAVLAAFLELIQLLLTDRLQALHSSIGPRRVYPLLPRRPLSTTGARAPALL